MKMEQRVEIGQRIWEVRVALGLNQRQFGKQLGFDGDKVSKLERGIKAPYESILRLIHLTYDVNLDYLLYGKLPMFIDHSTTSIEQLQDKLSPRMQQLLVNIGDLLVDAEK